MFGVDAPSLIQLIKEELELEMKVLEGKAARKSVKNHMPILFLQKIKEMAYATVTLKFIIRNK